MTTVSPVVTQSGPMCVPKGPRWLRQSIAHRTDGHVTQEPDVLQLIATQPIKQQVCARCSRGVTWAMQRQRDRETERQRDRIHRRWVPSSGQLMQGFGGLLTDIHRSGSGSTQGTGSRGQSSSSAASQHW